MCCIGYTWAVSSVCMSYPITFGRIPRLLVGTCKCLVLVLLVIGKLVVFKPCSQCVGSAGFMQAFC